VTENPKNLHTASDLMQLRDGCFSVEKGLVGEGVAPAGRKALKIRKKYNLKETRFEGSSSQIGFPKKRPLGRTQAGRNLFRWRGKREILHTCSGRSGLLHI